MAAREQPMTMNSHSVSVLEGDTVVVGRRTIGGQSLGSLSTDTSAAPAHA